MKTLNDENAVFTQSNGILGFAFLLCPCLEIKERRDHGLAVYDLCDITLDPFNIERVDRFKIRPSLPVVNELLQIVVIVKREVACLAAGLSDGLCKP